MSVTRRHGRTNGCWTCKLRRKKCDEIQPTCGDCTSLEIACTYGPKPTWMDSENQQQRKMAQLKDEIKRKTSRRREKGHASSDRVAREHETHQVNIIPDIVISNDPAGSITQTSPPLNSTPPITTAPFPFSLLPPNHQHYSSNTAGLRSPIQADFITKYLDSVFPALFPFYRPTLFDTGRSWLLQLLERSQTAHHAALSMSCYFFTMALIDLEGTAGEHADCRLLRWNEVEGHMQKCFDGLRTNMLALDLDSQGVGKLARVEALESVVHVLIFEMALGKAAPWNSHLPPAFALLQEIMACDDTSHHPSKLTLVLLEIGSPLWTNPADGTHIWSPAQASFRFCAALLIFVDVIASTALRKQPKLIDCYVELLAEVDDGTCLPSDAEIRLSTVVGARNWVIRVIRRISALDAWKGERAATNSLDMIQLFNHASHITNVINSGIIRLQEGPMTRLRSHQHPRSPFDIAPDPSASSTPTLIWAHAAQLYLTVVVSGWQLSNLDIRNSVARIIALLQTVPPFQMRALAWPICVAGCLASETEEQDFLRLSAGLGKVNTAGALDDALQIMEMVWRRRGVLDVTTWDLASCFSILGSPILLV